jgi:two-component system chemotaxis response regulator CheB
MVVDKEAADADVLQIGMAYFASGDKQMIIEIKAEQAIMRIREALLNQTCNSSVDITFQSVGKSYPNNTLAQFFTGMRANGRDDCRILKRSGSVIWSQYQDSSDMNGMPTAVTEIRCISLPDISNNIDMRV